jgi:hypothetical protein
MKSASPAVEVQKEELFTLLQTGTFHVALTAKITFLQK